MSEAQTHAVVENTVAKNTAVEKRSIQMKQFRDRDSIKRCIDTQTSIALGQVIGHAFDVVMKKGTLPDGSPSTSPFIVGDFEAVNYKTGEVMSASGAYLPKYFAETIQAALTKGAGATHGIAFAIEVVVEPTGKEPPAIQIAYGVKRLVARRPDSPIEQMKRTLQAAGTLRLPAPQTAPQSALTDDSLLEPEGNIEPPADEQEGEGGEVHAASAPHAENAASAEAPAATETASKRARK